LSQVHPELEESAQVCGMRNATLMRRIVLPLVKPSLLYLAIWTAMLSFQEVTMALFLSGPHNQVLSVSIWELWEGGHIGRASAGAVAMIGVTGSLMLIIFKISGNSSSGTLGGSHPPSVNVPR
jgi:iron(III) transport system permease protein